MAWHEHEQRVSPVGRERRSIPAPAAARRKRTPRAGPRSKRDQILAVATDYFGRYGYEETKWADVAAAVDIGPTALYHYFESKQHSLYEIIARSVANFHARFDATGKKVQNARIRKAVLNGQVIHEEQELLTPTGDRYKDAEMFEGPLMVQADHGPVAFRTLRVRVLSDKQEVK